MTNERARFVERLTGPDRPAATKWQVVGTGLGIPCLLENRSVGFLFGDTFATATPDAPVPDYVKLWRSPVMLRSNVHPATPGGIVFDSAARINGVGIAPQL